MGHGGNDQPYHVAEVRRVEFLLSIIVEKFLPLGTRHLVSKHTNMTTFRKIWMQIFSFDFDGRASILTIGS